MRSAGAAVLLAGVFLGLGMWAGCEHPKPKRIRDETVYIERLAGRGG